MKTHPYLLNAIVLFVVVVSFGAACKKSATSASKFDIRKDSTGSYLIRTILRYSYDSVGNNIVDSGTTTWTYDTQGRETAMIMVGSSVVDTDLISYPAGRINTVRTVISPNLYEHQDITDFLNQQGTADSTILNGIYNDTIRGVAYHTQTAVYTYYYRDGNGNDTLDKAYNWNGNVKTLSTLTRKTYLNNDLATVNGVFANNQKMSSQTWSGGDLLTDTTYALNNVITRTRIFTYNTIPSGGLAIWLGDRDLTATLQQQAGGTTTSETAAYTFDSSNRVSTLTWTRPSGTVIAKYRFIYY